MAFFVPGDLADLHVYILDAMGHSIGSITPRQYAMLKPSEFEHLGDEHPRLLRALCRDSLLSAPIQRELLVSVGLAGNGLCRFPLTQSDIGDALGMTQPHVSRTVKDLNATGVVTIWRRTSGVNDLAGLRKLAVFNPNHLHHLYEAAL